MNETQFSIAAYALLLAMKAVMNDDEFSEAANEVLAQAPPVVKKEGRKIAGQLLESL